MSPTMTEGGIASWKLKEGDPFTTGDVLLEIETDKATIDVEAQDDGIMGKILAPDGAKGIPVGQVIALLAEEGDDISNLEAPKEQPKPNAEPAKADAPSPPPPPPSSAPSPPAASHSSKHIEHSRPLFPSVARLLVEHNVEDPEKIKGTGIRGMLTKGDVLAFLGKASSPTGTYKEEKKSEAPKKAEAKADKPLDGAAIRRLIVGSMYEASAKARAAAAPRLTADFDSLIADYLPSSAPPPSKAPVPPPTPKSRSNDFLDGLV
ncbi:single hybrid motif-containing protein [Artomyces pyxidatus]|uniref:Single hybrid motif-containing protein n=1 Tax=Artomyces pyxidatus TaxID=48021 RepID=A0ACB8SS66_9AGAM|nr:single hybrid motif-containing protein [Artomyces pyxidatus]